MWPNKCAPHVFVGSGPVKCCSKCPLECQESFHSMAWFFIRLELGEEISHPEGTKISHLGRRNNMFKCAFKGDIMLAPTGGYISSLIHIFGKLYNYISSPCECHISPTTNENHSLSRVFSDRCGGFNFFAILWFPFLGKWSQLDYFLFQHWVASPPTTPPRKYTTFTILPTKSMFEDDHPLSLTFSLSLGYGLIPLGGLSIIPKTTDLHGSDPTWRYEARYQRRQWLRKMNMPIASMAPWDERYIHLHLPYKINQMYGIGKYTIYMDPIWDGKWEYGPLGNGKTSSKPSCSGSILIFGGVIQVLPESHGWLIGMHSSHERHTYYAVVNRGFLRRLQETLFRCQTSMCSSGALTPAFLLQSYTNCTLATRLGIGLLKDRQDTHTYDVLTCHWASYRWYIIELQTCQYCIPFFATSKHNLEMAFAEIDCMMTFSSWRVPGR